MVLGILGLLLLGVVMLWPLTLLLAINTTAGDLAFYMLLAESAVMALAGVPIFILSVLYRRGGAWAIVGMVAGIVGTLAGLVTAFLPFVL